MQVEQNTKLQFDFGGEYSSFRTVLSLTEPRIFNEKDHKTFKAKIDFGIQKLREGSGKFKGWFRGEIQVLLVDTLWGHVT